VPFYPADQQSRAVCPVCSEGRPHKEEGGDVTPKNLYAVHNLRDEDFEPQYLLDHETLFSDLQIPTAALFAGDPLMEGTKVSMPWIAIDVYSLLLTPLQFQYIALYRYSERLRDRLDNREWGRDDLQSKMDAEKHRFARGMDMKAVDTEGEWKLPVMMWNLRERYNDLKEEKASLEKDIEELRQEVIQWDCWKRRQAEITIYMRLLTPLAKYAKGTGTALSSC